jgi:hypothetical protein
VLTQPLPDTLGVIGFVTAYAPRPSLHPSLRASHLHAVNQLLELRRLVCWAGEQECVERQTIAINQDVELGAEAAAGAP